jgi:glycosyltransferase involved in cell wall biosynthesis
MRIAVHDYAGHPFVFDLSRELARRGHEVGHFYFEGDKGPKGALSLPGDPSTFSVHPVGIGREYDKANFISRGLNDIAYGHAVSKAIEIFKPDVVLSANTPLESQRVLFASTRRMGAGFIFWMQDFYSLAIRRLLRHRWYGLGRLITYYFHKLEERLLHKSDAIVYISPDFIKSAKIFKLGSTPTHVIPNWASIENIPVRPKKNAWSEANGLSDKFVFLYSGTLALKHNPMLLRALAERFADRPDVVVVVAAHGVGRDELEASLAANPIPSLKLFDLQPIASLPDMLGTADVVVALLEGDAGEFSVPSKVLSYYCSARPLLLSAPLNNLASRTTAANGCGVVSEPKDVEAFLTAAAHYLSDADARTKAGKSARTYAEENFKIPAVAAEFEVILQAAADSHRR